MTEEDKFALAIRRLGTASKHLDEFSLVADALPAVPEPDDPARRAAWRRAKTEYDERLRDARKLSQVVYANVQ